VLLVGRAGDRERKPLREDIRKLAEAQSNTDRNLALLVEHFDRKVDALTEGQAEMQRAIARMAEAVAGHETRYRQAGRRRGAARTKLYGTPEEVAEFLAAYHQGYQL
jgi:alkanesulfonate monooxygenase SsuD/methylene tetrahydromethanopterin reductase-like flavin-dependent oxidoreductase (luciferase family)